MYKNDITFYIYMNPNSHQVHILYSVHFVQRYALETLIAMVIIYRVLIGEQHPYTYLFAPDCL